MAHKKPLQTISEVSLSVPGEHITSPRPAAECHLQKLSAADLFWSTVSVPTGSRFQCMAHKKPLRTISEVSLSVLGEYITSSRPAAECHLQKLSAADLFQSTVSVPTGSRFQCMAHKKPLRTISEVSLSVPGEYITSPRPAAECHLQKLSAADLFRTTVSVPTGSHFQCMAHKNPLRTISEVSLSVLGDHITLSRPAAECHLQKLSAADLFRTTVSVPTGSCF
jgi:DNA-binding MarR family transcriptional regulator